jgi:hypothetical protein
VRDVLKATLDDPLTPLYSKAAVEGGPLMWRLDDFEPVVHVGLGPNIEGDVWWWFGSPPQRVGLSVVDGVGCTRPTVTSWDEGRIDPGYSGHIQIGGGRHGDAVH